MVSDDQFDRLRADVVALRVAHGGLRGRVRNLEQNTPAADGRLHEALDELAGVVDELRRQVDALNRWRWQVAGATGAIAFLAEPLWQAVLHGLGLH